MYDDRVLDLIRERQILRRNREIGAREGWDELHQHVAEVNARFLRKLTGQGIHRKHHHSAALETIPGLARDRIVDIRGSPGVRAPDGALNSAIHVAADIADDAEPRCALLEERGQILPCRETRIARLPVDAVHQDGQMGEVRGEDRFIQVGVCIIILQIEGAPVLAGRHVLLLVHHLDEGRCLVMAFCHVAREVLGRHVLVGEEVEDLLGSLRNVTVPREPDDERNELGREAGLRDLFSLLA